jgi:arylsulfatase A-like enzyme
MNSSEIRKSSLNLSTNRKLKIAGIINNQLCYLYLVKMIGTKILIHPLLILVLIVCSCQMNKTRESSQPNIILIMSDDQGWGDAGFQGHPFLQTPHLDQMASQGIRFERFYSSSPVCSPTRGSCLTGRHPFRYGIYGANIGHLPEEEITLAEILKENGYTTGHFGKWHLGTLTTTEVDANRGRPGQTEHYSPPWDNGFDVCFSTESKVPTWDPMVTPTKETMDIGNREPGNHFGTFYWEGPGKKVSSNLNGDDSRIIMDRVLPFIQEAKNSDLPFLAVIWFHSPHLPVLTGENYRSLYDHLTVDQQHFYGCITAMGEQIGRLNSRLDDLDIADNTLIWFCSDNGPEGKEMTHRTQGTTNGLRGRKRSLFEGGVRVPALVKWPAKIKKPRSVDIACTTTDYLPTILEILGISVNNMDLDGISLVPILEQTMKCRPEPIGFIHDQQVALVGNQYKLISQNQGESYLLFNLADDPAEEFDLADSLPELKEQMIAELQVWINRIQNKHK